MVKYAWQVVFRYQKINSICICKGQGKDYEEEMRRINEKYNKGEEEQQGGGSEVKKRMI